VAPDFDHLPTFLMGMSTPVIAAIGGPAAGLGFVLACCCDVRFAAAGAKMTAAHGPLGLPAEMAVSWVLPRIVGLGRAADLLISSRVILGDEAADLGLVNAALPTPEATVEHAFTYAREMARRVAPASLAASKRQLYLDQLRSLDDSARDARTRLDEHMAGPDFAEGVAALSERRPPRWG
jgi:enoyl-CoA hydratase/carnithine racemase